ncbi:MAG: DUF1559 domain-containing protein, partial [Victivallales bacterium]|nr:DUF1559 domain-containing protein [Victivallales bacterium]
ARQKARQISCVNNLKQVGLYANMYADDYEGTLLIIYRDASYFASATRRVPGLAFYMYKAGLWDVQTASKMNRCPTDGIYGQYVAGGSEVYNLWPQFACGYTYNNTANANMMKLTTADKVPGVSTNWSSGGSHTIVVYQVPAPSRFLLATEGASAGAWWANGLHTDADNVGWSEALNSSNLASVRFDRHGGQVNNLIVDGHVESMTKGQMLHEYSFSE